MAEAFYRINNVDILPYLVDEGFLWEENDIDSDGSGRDMSGTMWRGLVARKDKHTLKFRTLTLEEMRTLSSAINTQYVTVTTNIHPKRYGEVTLTMYNSTRKGAVYTLADDGESTWKPEDLSLIER